MTGQAPYSFAAASFSAAMASFQGKGPWLIRATPVSATSLAEGAPGKAMKFTGSGEAAQKRSSSARSDSSGTKKPLAPASA